ncbi:dTDP-4-dehydrorhamnose reductase [Flavobacterium sp. CBA20B-1]|uniref:dTDP-4-dehydrorhamnose reductase n=1 Tax=unclassified Flavobacterium TaxID=196869 RepID=UPI0022242B10|nr:MULTISPECIES: dTDP-4-dehydrorhamnose reductase [unclassified Flavobacterium]WCM43150.1 dTDP-4-dehydrorhamnose reductase [Flavobacterium sp. CBA20B-1]
MKILITGRQGQLGSELYDLKELYPQHQMVFVDREEMDLSNPEQILEVLKTEKPGIIVSAGAYTAVDKAESDQELCNAVNHIAVQTIGEWAATNQAKVIHISTDYVFDGNSETPLKETDTPDPINVYGQTKLQGEQALQASGANNVIIRTAWVYSTYGANFVKTMLRLMSERDEIGVVADQVGTPTYARDLAQAIMTIVEAPVFVQGVYHYSNEGKISWHEFATAIKEIKGFSTTVNAIGSDAFPTPAKRPHFSLLDKSKIKEVYQVAVPHWKTSLEEMLLKMR